MRYRQKKCHKHKNQHRKCKKNRTFKNDFSSVIQMPRKILQNWSLSALAYDWQWILTEAISQLNFYSIPIWVALY